MIVEADGIHAAAGVLGQADVVGKPNVLVVLRIQHTVSDTGHGDIQHVTLLRVRHTLHLPPLNSGADIRGVTVGLKPSSSVLLAWYQAEALVTG